MKSKLIPLAIADALLALSGGAAHAATLTVTTTLSGTATGDGECSLAEAISNANDDAATYADCAAGSGADTIELPAGQTITLTAALPTVESEVTIQGNGATITRDTSLTCSAVSHVGFGILRAYHATLGVSSATLSHGCEYSFIVGFTSQRAGAVSAL